MKVYPDKSFDDQFTVRVLLKEVSGQLSSLMRNIDAASDHMEREAMTDRLETVSGVFSRNCRGKKSTNLGNILSNIWQVKFKMCSS